MASASISPQSLKNPQPLNPPASYSYTAIALTTLFCAGSACIASGILFSIKPLWIGGSVSLVCDVVVGLCIFTKRFVDAKEVAKKDEFHISSSSGQLDSKKEVSILKLQEESFWKQSSNVISKSIHSIPWNDIIFLLAMKEIPSSYHKELYLALKSHPESDEEKRCRYWASYLSPSVIELMEEKEIAKVYGKHIISLWILGTLETIPLAESFSEGTRVFWKDVPECHRKLLAATFKYYPHLENNVPSFEQFLQKCFVSADLITIDEPKITSLIQLLIDLEIDLSEFFQTDISSKLFQEVQKRYFELSLKCQDQEKRLLCYRTLFSHVSAISWILVFLRDLSLRDKVVERLDELIGCIPAIDTLYLVGECDKEVELCLLNVLRNHPEKGKVYYSSKRTLTILELMKEEDLALFLGDRVVNYFSSSKNSKDPLFMYEKQEIKWNDVNGKIIKSVVNHFSKLTQKSITLSQFFLNLVSFEERKAWPKEVLNFLHHHHIHVCTVFNDASLSVDKQLIRFAGHYLTTAFHLENEQDKEKALRNFFASQRGLEILTNMKSMLSQDFKGNLVTYMKGKQFNLDWISPLTT